MPWKVPEQYRITEQVAGKLKNIYGNKISDKNLSHWISDESVGEQGFFMLPNFKTKKGLFMLCLASNGMGWEHVSVSIPTENRCPTWEEMCWVKSLFWDETDAVVQFHPPATEYVNNHEFCLHLWKQVGIEFNLPSSELVGYKIKS